MQLNELAEKIHYVVKAFFFTSVEKLANAVSYCKMRHEMESKTMIGMMKVSNELAAKARKKTNFKNLR